MRNKSCSCLRKYSALPSMLLLTQAPLISATGHHSPNSLFLTPDWYNETFLLLHSRDGLRDKITERGGCQDSLISSGLSWFSWNSKNIRIDLKHSLDNLRNYSKLFLGKNVMQEIVFFLFVCLRNGNINDEEEELHPAGICWVNRSAGWGRLGRLSISVQSMSMLLPSGMSS